MLKVILDTNVIIASFRSRNGASHRLVSMIGSGRFELIMSVTLAIEYEAILKRQASEIGMTLGDIDDFVGFICANAIRQEVNAATWPIANDPGDEFLARLALASRCDYLVTHNVRDLQPISESGILVVTPKDFLPIIRGRS